MFSLGGEEGDLSQLHYASLRGKTKEVAALVSAAHATRTEHVLEQTSRFGRSALHFSAMGLHTDTMVELLVNGQADPNVSDSVEGAAPLHFVCNSTSMQSEHSGAQVRKAARILLSAGGNINAKTRFGHTPLHFACSRTTSGGAPLVEVLIKSGAQVEAVTHLGETPLHVAVKYGAVGCARILIANGADIDAIDARGYSPLATAASSGSNACVRLLLQCGAGQSHDSRVPPASLTKDPAVKLMLQENRLQSRREGILSLTLSKKNPCFVPPEPLLAPKYVAKLLQRIHAKKKAEKLARKARQEELAELQVEEQEERSSERGTLPVSPMKRIRQLRAENKSKTSTYDNSLANQRTSHVTPGCVYRAVIGDKPTKTVTYLVTRLGKLQLEEELKWTDVLGRTALHMACDKGDSSVVSILLNTGAYVEAVDQYGFRPLILACRSGHMQTAVLLIENIPPASLNTCDTFIGLSCAEWARAGNHADLYEMLKKKGAPHTDDSIDTTNSSSYSTGFAAHLSDPCLLATQRKINTNTPTDVSNIIERTEEAILFHRLAITGDTVGLMKLAETLHKTEKAQLQEARLQDQPGAQNFPERPPWFPPNANSHTVSSPSRVARCVRPTREGLVGSKSCWRCSNYAERNISGKGVHGLTGLHLCANGGHHYACAVLIAMGCNIHARDSLGHEALHYAAASGCYRTVRVLLGAGAMTSAATSRGATPIQYAEKRGHQAVIAELRRAASAPPGKNVTGKNIPPVPQERRSFSSFSPPKDQNVLQLQLGESLRGPPVPAYTNTNSGSIDNFVSKKSPTGSSSNLLGPPTYTNTTFTSVDNYIVSGQNEAVNGAADVKNLVSKKSTSGSSGSLLDALTRGTHENQNVNPIGSLHTTTLSSSGDAHNRNIEVSESKEVVTVSSIIANRWIVTPADTHTNTSGTGNMSTSNIEPTHSLDKIELEREHDTKRHENHTNIDMKNTNTEMPRKISTKRKSIISTENHNVASFDNISGIEHPEASYNTAPESESLISPMRVPKENGEQNSGTFFAERSQEQIFPGKEVQVRHSSISKPADLRSIPGTEQKNFPGTILAKDHVDDNKSSDSDSIDPLADYMDGDHAASMSTDSGSVSSESGEPRLDGDKKPPKRRGTDELLQLTEVITRKKG